MYNTPEHNGIVEQLNHTILEKVRAKLHASGQPHFLWGGVVYHAIWLKNCTATKVLDGKTPFEVAIGKKPNLSRLREWNCHVWVRNQENSKLGGCITKGIWVSFDIKSNRSQIYWPAKKTINIECNCYFDDITRPSDYLERKEEAIVEVLRVPSSTSTSNLEIPHFKPLSTHQPSPTHDDNNGNQC